MEIRQAAIVGAGAVGAYFIRGMQPAMGERFMVLAEGNRAQRLKENGLVINGERVPLNVQDFASAPQVDLLIISTKYTALQEIFGKVKPLVGQDTVVLTVLNGIDSEELAGAALGAEHIVYSYMVIVSARKGDSIVIDPACPKHELRQEGGKLCDLCPTMLDLMGLEQPKEMTGQSLIVR